MCRNRIMLTSATLCLAPGAESSADFLRRVHLNAGSTAGWRQRMDPLKPFGSAHYAEWPPPPTWANLGTGERFDSASDRLGAACDSPGLGQGGQQAQAQSRINLTIGCGSQLVCRGGLCRHCSVDSECGPRHECVAHFAELGLCTPVERKAWERVLLDADTGEICCTMLVLLASVLAAIAGMSGGGVFVPALLLLSGADAESAVPLSQCLTACGSLTNFFYFVSHRHPSRHWQPRIDYDCIALFEPMLVLGVTVGVVLHEVVPRWLLLVLLCVTLATALWRVASKGLQQLSDEKVCIADTSAGSTHLAEAPSLLARLTAYADDSSELLRASGKQLVAIVFVWVLTLAHSFENTSVCTAKFVLYFSLLVVALVGCTVASQRFVISDAGRWKAKPTTHDAAKLSVVAFAAGTLGGTCGLGGGIVVGPVLLELGLPGEVVQATTSVFVLLSSSLATVQFALLSDRLLWHYALWYGAVAVMATAVGLSICEECIRRHRRHSIIPLSIAAILLVSLLALSVAGSIQVAQDIQAWERMWFSASRLCMKGPDILTVGVAPSPRLPALAPHGVL